MTERDVRACHSMRRARHTSSCEGAYQGGRLEVLKWLRSEVVNCPWDIQECLRQAKDGIYRRHEKVVTWVESFLKTNIDRLNLFDPKAKNKTGVRKIV